MNQDIRISVSFTDHAKTVKLKRRLGSDAVICLVRLWCYAAVNKPSGVLIGMDAEDVEIAAKWEGEQGAFVAALLDPKIFYLEDTNGQLSLHDWQDHNPYAFHANSRRLKAKNAAAARHAKTSTEHSGKPDQALLNVPVSTAPYPSPVPNPSPSPVPSPTALAPANACAFIALVLNTGEEYLITEAQRAEWETLFPAVNVAQELRNMRAWCLANPRNCKTQSGVLRFVNKWLTKAQNEAKTRNGNGSHYRRASGRKTFEDYTAEDQPLIGEAKRVD